MYLWDVMLLWKYRDSYIRKEIMLRRQKREENERLYKTVFRLILLRLFQDYKNIRLVNFTHDYYLFIYKCLWFLYVTGWISLPLNILIPTIFVQFLL